MKGHEEKEKLDKAGEESRDEEKCVDIREQKMAESKSAEESGECNYGLLRLWRQCGKACACVAPCEKSTERMCSVCCGKANMRSARGSMSCHIIVRLHPQSK